MADREREPIKFEIIKHFGVLSTSQTGWKKEFNIVRWNDKSDKYDIRDWAPGHERMSKGVTLYEHEMKKIIELCADIFVDDQEQCAGEEQTPELIQQDEEKSAEEIPF